MGGSKGFFKGLLKSGIFLLLVGAIAGIFLFGFIKAFWQDYQIKKEINQLMLEKEKWEKNKLVSLEKLQEIKNGDFAEREARLKFGLGKEGEKLVIINSAAATVSSTKKEVKMSNASAFNPKNWWNYFFK
ncbi:MAG: hypothetical protein HZC05_00825 [Candidatus Magasanikbacteria bacterium]|nr:hypothetical protein [Candidatus Magasanikbacteria bacterium]